MSTPVGPYAPSLAAGDWLVCSGQVGISPGPDGPQLAEGFAAQTRQALHNVRQLLSDAGLSWPAVVKVTAFLADIGDYAEFNQLYLEELGDHRPARSVVAVAGLPLGARVEIEVWAWVGASSGS
jgi:2-iminobutanoate/2-iminopropanoate deaminase